MTTTNMTPLRRPSFQRTAFFAIAALTACSSKGSDSNANAPDSGQDNSVDAGPLDIKTQILGTWKSKDCEPSGTTSSRVRTYVFTPTNVHITYEIFAGSACEAGPKVLTVTTNGNAAFVGPSATIPHASNVVFTFSSRSITPEAAGVALLKSTCGQYTWAAGVEVSVTKDGCGALVQSDTECPIEYDLAAIIDNVAYFGDRTHPLCTEATRPAALAQWGVVQEP